MPLKQIDYGSKEYDQMLQLRYEVLREPLGLTFTPEELERAKRDILLGCFDEDELQACCMLTPKGDVVKLRQMAVKKGLQGTGLGRIMMIFAENVARDQGFKKLIMHARSSAIGFYEKLGYNISSEEFLELTIAHYEMEKDL
jgi:N-acetylglutamate synthase-like GNAT family acetyltransferase